jgi:hypothetical protein
MTIFVNNYDISDRMMLAALATQSRHPCPPHLRVVEKKKEEAKDKKIDAIDKTIDRKRGRIAQTVAAKMLNVKRENDKKLCKVYTTDIIVKFCTIKSFWQSFCNLKYGLVSFCISSSFRIQFFGRSTDFFHSRNTVESLMPNTLATACALNWQSTAWPKYARASDISICG